MNIDAWNAVLYETQYGVLQRNLVCWLTKAGCITLCSGASLHKIKYQFARHSSLNFLEILPKISPLPRAVCQQQHYLLLSISRNGDAATDIRARLRAVPVHSRPAEQRPGTAPTLGCTAILCLFQTGSSFGPIPHGALRQCIAIA